MWPRCGALTPPLCVAACCAASPRCSRSRPRSWPPTRPSRSRRRAPATPPRSTWRTTSCCRRSFTLCSCLCLYGYIFISLCIYDAELGGQRHDTGFTTCCVHEMKQNGKRVSVRCCCSSPQWGQHWSSATWTLHIFKETHTHNVDSTNTHTMWIAHIYTHTHAHTLVMWAMFYELKDHQVLCC